MCARICRCAGLLAATLLVACAVSRESALRTDGTLPLADPPPVSALRMYEAGVKDGKAQGRSQALDQLRRHPIFANPVDLTICPDRVSWLPRKPKIPDPVWWDSRWENLKLKAECRNGEIDKAWVIRVQRKAVKNAR